MGYHVDRGSKDGPGDCSLTIHDAVAKAGKAARAKLQAFVWDQGPGSNLPLTFNLPSRAKASKDLESSGRGSIGPSR